MGVCTDFYVFVYMFVSMRVYTDFYASVAFKFSRKTRHRKP